MRGDMNNMCEIANNLGMIPPLEPDDFWGYRRRLNFAVQQKCWTNVVMAFVSCVISDTPFPQEMKDKVIEHLSDAYDYVQKHLVNCRKATGSLRKRCEEENEQWDKSEKIERILEMRCEVAILESLYGEQVRHKVELIDNELKSISDLFQFVKDSPLVDGWRQAMQNIGVNPWWLELQSA